MLCIQGFFEGGYGLRGVSKMVKIVGTFVHDSFSSIASKVESQIIKIPSYNTVKNWILKLGSYKLERSKSQCNDWVYLIDKTIQMGPDKCLAIIGVRLSSLDPDNLTLSHNDVEPLVIKVAQKCPGEAVCEALQEAQRKTGGYCQILSDGGSDIARGIRLFEGTSKHFYDITHKLALLINESLGKDPAWQAIVKNAVSMTQQIKLSSIANLAPPELRAKSSTLNLGGYVRWCCKLWSFVTNKAKQSPSEQVLIDEKCGWIIQYKDFLKEGLQIIKLADATKSLVHRHGYGRKMKEKFTEMVEDLPLKGRVEEFIKSVKLFIEEECRKVPEGAVRLGSTDILESIFGKFKRFEGQFADEGITTLIGALPAIMGTTTEQEITDALKHCTVEEARESWGMNGSGGTYLAKRRRNLSEIGDEFDLNFYSFQEEIKKVVGL
jgi:hypothetical protein